MHIQSIASVQIVCLFLWKWRDEWNLLLYKYTVKHSFFLFSDYFWLYSYVSNEKNDSSTENTSDCNMASVTKQLNLKP